MEKIQNKLLENAKIILAKNPKGKSFNSLWKDLIKMTKLDVKQSQVEIADFYMTLISSKEFVMLGNNKWSLRSIHGFAGVKVNIASAYNDDFQEGDSFIDEDDTEDIVIDEDDYGNGDEDKSFTDERQDTLDIGDEIINIDPSDLEEIKINIDEEEEQE